MKINYSKIILDLLSEFSKKEKEIISRRFGLRKKQRETLEAIGRDYGVCRERIRQIQDDVLSKIRLKSKKYPKVFQSFLKYLNKKGGLKKEDILLEELGSKRWKNEIYFLLSINNSFKRIKEDNDFYSFWITKPRSLDLAKRVIQSSLDNLQKAKKLLPLKKLNTSLNKKEVLESYIEISKKIQKSKKGLYGLSTWPEINPRGIKDKVYVIFKETGKPLHFSEAASLLKGAHVQTVHNELIKDPRFVLIGRGIYALSEWGYIPGEAKDVIFTILKNDGPLTKDKILRKVLKQRQIKKSTILLNLNNKDYFLRDSQGKYTIKEI